MSKSAISLSLYWVSLFRRVEKCSCSYTSNAVNKLSDAVEYSHAGSRTELSNKSNVKSNISCFVWQGLKKLSGAGFHVKSHKSDCGM